MLDGIRMASVVSVRYHRRHSCRGQYNHRSCQLVDPMLLRVSLDGAAAVISAGHGTSFAIMQDSGSLFAWGHSASGSLGLGAALMTQDCACPTIVPNIAAASFIAAGSQHTAVCCCDGRYRAVRPVVLTDGLCKQNPQVIHNRTESCRRIGCATWSFCQRLL